MKAVFSTVVCATCLSMGCEWDFERMIDQPSVRDFEATSFFADGTTMQDPPAGTVAWDGSGAAPLPKATTANGTFVRTIPLPIGRAQLERGRDRFHLFCAPCHGAEADGTSPVAESMALRRPPSLLSPQVVEAPAGRLFSIISGGYGLMPSYAWALTEEDRWAIVSFLQALQLSRSVPLGSLSPTERTEAERWLR